MDKNGVALSDTILPDSVYEMMVSEVNEKKMRERNNEESEESNQ